MKTCDVYSFGMVSSSTLYTLEGAFPSPQGYAEITDMQHMTGGEAANSSIVLARLGASVKLDGNWIGDNVAGQRTKKLLANYRIDSSRLPLRKGYECTQEIVFATGATRTIFRAGVVYGFLRGWRDERVVAFAAATAAIVCTRSPGVLNSPSYTEVLQLMQERD